MTKRIILLSSGEIIDDGCPNKVLTSKNISKLYNYEIDINRIKGYWKVTPINN